MQAGVGYSDIPDSTAAGIYAAEQAVAMSDRTDPCDIALLFCTARHDQRVLRKAVASVLGATVPVYGGGAVGVITNHDFGYAGDQVGVACLWLDGARCDIFTEGGLDRSEEDAGERLGRRIAERLEVTPESPVMLFYDAVGRDEMGKVRLKMATWLLKGLEKALGLLPDITGAGLQGDHICSLTSQYIGDGLRENVATALAFSGDVRIDSAIMHGCRPASAYYTVTKADGPVILEIDHKPALAFMDELLGSAIKPDDYPFFLLFGINHGERWGQYDETQYASRLCLDIDKERGGIVMFEPDMSEGTEFQLMFRAYDLEYMKPKIEALFENLNGRKPVFALYIDCAGRCAGYGGTDLEDALVLQKIVGERVPVLGLYTGVEIASVAGRPRGLDWTGGFCLFSQNEEGSQPGLPAAQRQSAARVSAKGHNISLDAMRKLCEQNAAKILAMDTQAITLRFELELMRRGFKLIAELNEYLRNSAGDYVDALVEVARRMNAALNMQKTLVLLSNGSGTFTPAVLQGFTSEEKERLSGKAVRIHEDLLCAEPALVTAQESSERYQPLRREFDLPFFIVSPILVQGEIVALLLTGRMVEQPPYMTRLARGDLETVQAITGLLSSVMLRLRLNDAILKAETDGLTGIWNRTTFQRMVEQHLREAEDSSGAFIMIDADHFKAINDTYGHISGDGVLKACATAMKSILRDSDFIGRQGGDEFVAFCRGIKNASMAKKKALSIAESWRQVVPAGGAAHVTASIGIALSPSHGTTFDELYHCADTALYIAKKRGRNCQVLYSGIR